MGQLEYPPPSRQWAIQKGLLGEADLTEQKAFIRSFVKRIEINRWQVTVNYA